MRQDPAKRDTKEQLLVSKWLNEIGLEHSLEEELEPYWADIFILLSDWEGLPLSILEAMRQGVIVIARAGFLSNCATINVAVWHGQV